jgi:hypothetical protein
MEGRREGRPSFLGQGLLCTAVEVAERLTVPVDARVERLGVLMQLDREGA